MKTRISPTLFALALVVAACRTAGFRSDPELMAAYGGAQAPSIYGLIGARERLGLTSAQVTTLDSVAEALRTGNRRLTDSLRAVTGARSGGPIPPPRDSLQRARFIPVLRQIGENNRAALRAVESALTGEQRRTVCEMAREQGGERRGRGMRGGVRGGVGEGGPEQDRRPGAPGMPPGPMSADSLTSSGPFGWPWCGAGNINPDSLRPRFQADSAGRG